MKRVLLNTLLGSCLLSTTAQTVWAADYPTLAATLQATLPEQALLANTQQLQSAAQSYANQTLPGEVTVKLNHENDALTDNKAKQTWEAGVEFPIWRSGQAHSQDALAQAYQNLFLAEQQQLKLLTAQTLRDLVWQTQTAKIKAHFSQKALEQTQALVEMVTQRVTQGENPKLDLLLAEKSLFAAQSDFATANFELEVALNTYQAKLNTQALPDLLPEQQAPADLLEQHPQRLKLQALIQIETAKLAALKANQQSNPSVYVGGKNEQSNQGVNDTFLIAQFNYPLQLDSLAGHQKVLQAEQQSQLSRLQAELRRFEQNHPLDLFRAQQAIFSAQTQQQLSEQQLTHAEKTLMLAKQSYFLGETSIQNLLISQQTVLEQKLAARLAKTKTFMAIADFNQIAGVAF
ncbi:TolC family protein [Thiosulfativibrio zosterae]|uniref:Transporter n=1 Tax=Thiosulfativibrio zosterae TaxID=2675053 RepID=A0A6F8PMN1_9GAMM|nr:TolC family protein [Thiosulfativibrio zosterae]BBP43346.1 hypothetical protein THMIRHAT_10920 [Thiosulfativibrio zosterae]